MPRAQTNGIEIEYEEFGDPSRPPVLLIMGLGAQMILWEEEFCERLAAAGHRVVRFDNRDVGLSTKLERAGVPDVGAAMTAVARRQPIDAPYLLSDMAADTAGLLDSLGLDSAHVVGASMGGMIAQAFAIQHPRRTRSLTSIMSTTGSPDLPPAKPEAMAILLGPPPTNRAEALERGVTVFRTIGSPGFPFDAERVRGIAGRSFDRCFHPQGVARQLVAVLASGSRKERLGAVKVPTLVIHGADDPLVPVEAGLDTAQAIPGAEMMVIDGMGHDLPPGIWSRVIEGISRLVERAEGAG